MCCRKQPILFNRRKSGYSLATRCFTGVAIKAVLSDRTKTRSESDLALQITREREIKINLNCVWNVNCRLTGSRLMCSSLLLFLMAQLDVYCREYMQCRNTAVSQSEASCDVKCGGKHRCNMAKNSEGRGRQSWPQILGNLIYERVTLERLVTFIWIIL